MNTTTIKVTVLSLAAMALTACTPPKSAVPEPQADAALRNMLRIRCLTGSFTVPPGEDYYAVAVCDYEDGQLVRRTVMLSGNASAEPSRKVQPQLLWGNVEGKTLVSVSLNGSGGPLEDVFWNGLDRSIYNTKTPGTTPDGWIALGHACSDVPRNPTSPRGLMSDFRVQLESSKHVGALVIRSFKTEEEWRRAAKDFSKPSQESGKAGAE